MSEHRYPQNLPRDDQRPSVRVAWQIMDTVRPGVIPAIIRFDLARQIANACAGVDEIQAAALRTIDLSRFWMSMEPDKVDRIAEISPELVRHMARLLFRPANENQGQPESSAP